MRISDWSSDVCSSDVEVGPIADLGQEGFGFVGRPENEVISLGRAVGVKRPEHRKPGHLDDQHALAALAACRVDDDMGTHLPLALAIGRASCRESGGQYV